MKKVMITVIAMFLLICWPLGGLWGAMLSPLMGGEVSETHCIPSTAGSSCWRAWSSAVRRSYAKGLSSLRPS